MGGLIQSKVWSGLLGAGISGEDTSVMLCIFIRGAAAVEITSLLSVRRSNGIRCISIERKDGGIKLFCYSYSDVDGIFEEGGTSALRMINCDTLMSRNLKAKISLIVKSCGAMVNNR